MTYEGLWPSGKARKISETGAQVTVQESGLCMGLHLTFFGQG